MTKSCCCLTSLKSKFLFANLPVMQRVYSSLQCLMGAAGPETASAQILLWLLPKMGSSSHNGCKALASLWHWFTHGRIWKHPLDIITLCCDTYFYLCFLQSGTREAESHHSLLMMGPMYLRLPGWGFVSAISLQTCHQQHISLWSTLLSTNQVVSERHKKASKTTTLLSPRLYGE